MINPRIDEYGNQYWHNSNHQFHREDGPAIIYFNGTQEWYQIGKLHRINGPAIIYADGRQAWCVNGNLHRTDGPAIIFADGYKEWFLNDVKITNEDDIKLFTGKDDDLIVLKLKYGF